MDVEDFREDRGLLRELLSHRAFRRNVPTLFLASLSINGLSLALPLVLMQVYDRIIPTQAMSTLTWLGVMFGAALCVETVLRLCRSTVSNWMASRFDHFVSSSCVDTWLRSDLVDFERDGVGMHMDQLSAVGALRNFFAGQAFQMLMDLPFVLLFIGVIHFLGGGLLSIFVTCVMLVYALAAVMVKAGYGRRRESQKTLNERRYNFLVEALGGIHTVKSLTAEEQMLRRHESLQADMAGNNFHTSFNGMLPANMGTLFSHITLFGVLLVGGFEVIAGQMTLGALAACSILGGRALQPVQNFAAFVVRHADIRIARDRISRSAQLQEDAPEDAPSLPAEIEGRVTFDNVSFRYGNDADWIFEDMNLDIKPGEMVCIAGAEGSGTSTTLSLAMGVARPSKGRILVDGEYDLAEYGRQNLKGRMEYVTQDNVLFNGSIYDNITMFNDLDRERAHDAAALMGLEDIVSELPQGFETQVGQRLYEFLPSGIIQRICLARALTVRPRVLILDKVTESMDSESERILLWLLAKLKGKCTILAATSSEAIIDLSDRFYRLRQGQFTQVDASMRRTAQAKKGGAA